MDLNFLKDKYKQMMTSGVQTLSNIASNPTLNKWATGQPLTNAKRFEFKRTAQTPLGQTAQGLAYAIPESIINTPRNWVTGMTRTGKEIGQSLRDKRPLNYQNLVGGVAPLAEGILDVGTMGGFTLAKGIAKEGGKQILKSGFKQAVKKGAIKGAGWGAFGGTTYGLDTQYGKEFNAGEVAGSIAAGTLLGSVLGGGIAALGSIKGLLIKPKSNVDKQLRNKAGEWTAGKILQKPEGMSKAQWNFQLEFNKKYGRNPYTPVYDSDLKKAIKIESEKRVGMQVRDVNEDIIPTQVSKGRSGNIGDIKGKILYHGTNNASAENILKNGGFTKSSSPVYLGGKESTSLEYAKGGKMLQFDTGELKIAPSSEVIPISNKFDSINDSKEFENAIINYFKKKGYDGIEAGNQTIVFKNQDKLKLIPTQPKGVGGEKVKLYHGSNKSLSREGLDYGTFLTASKEEALDYAKMRSGGRGGKAIISEFEFDPSEVRLNQGTGEYQFIGKTKNLSGGKYPEQIYRSLNDAWGTNMTRKEIDALSFDEVRNNASMGMSGGRDEFDKLVQTIPTQASKGVKVKPQEAKRLDQIAKAQEEALQKSKELPVSTKIVAPKKVKPLSVSGEVTPGKPGDLSHPSPTTLSQDKYAFNVNMNRLDVTPQEKQVLKSTVESIKPELQRIKGKVLSNDEVIKAAKGSEMLGKITTRDETLKAEAAVLKARQTITTLDKEVTQLVQNGNTPKLQAKMGELIDSLRVVSGNAADAGRKLQSLSIDAGDESVRMTMLKDISKIEGDTQKILNEATNVDWENANSIATFYRKFIKPTTTEVLDEFRYNNMLSNPRTHIRNAFSNLVQTFVTRPATILAQGKVGKTARYYQGSIKSLPDAFGAFADSFTGKTAIAKPDIEHITTGKLPKLLTVPTRAMEAMDRFFSTIIKGGEMAGGATAKEAQGVAEYSLFRQGLKPEGQGTVLNAIDNATEGVYQMGKKIPLLRWFVPFVRTPMNFAKQWIEYSPTGLTTLPGAANKGEQLAKTMLGSVVTLAGAKLALDGNTTWAAPTDPKEKELFYASGRKPYSFRIGDKWVSMMYSGPFAYALALPAAVNYYQTESRTALTDDQMAKLGKITSSMAEFLSGQTFMEGIGNFVSMFRGDADYSLGKNLGYTASQFIPLQGLVRWVSTVVDPVYRKTKTAPEQIMSTIPFMSQNLEPYTNPMGEPSTRERVNLLTPYDITPTNQTYEPMLQQRTEKLQSNAVENKIKKDIEESKETQVSGNKVYYWDEEAANVKTIDLTPIKQPSLTGQEELDKIKISSYNSKVTAQIKNIAKLEELGQITADEAETKIKELTEMKITAPKKAKKLTLKKVTMPKIPAPVKVKKIKVKRPTKTVKSLRASKAKITTKKINLNAKVG